MNKRESLNNQLKTLNDEAAFHKDLRSVFGTDAGLRVFEYILNLGNFGGIVRGDEACGGYNVVSQIWTDVSKAAPEVTKAFIDMYSSEVFKNRQAQLCYTGIHFSS